MGLDMYLKGRRYLRKYKPEEKEISFKISEHFPELDFFRGEDDDSSMEISVEVGYWRKANAIHNWFVQNVQNGTDDCGTYWVYVDKLKLLRETCQDVLDNKELAQQLLPSTSGFFFGNQDYDEWYFMQIENTIRIIDSALEMPDAWDFQYHSSW